METTSLPRPPVLAPDAGEGPPVLSADQVGAMLRFLLDRGPRDAAELAALRQLPTQKALRETLFRSEEFGRLYRAALRHSAGYAMPLFMLQPPADRAVPWHFAEPGLADPVTQLCTAAQLQGPEHARWCRLMKVAPRQHRKQWEFAWILAALEKAGMLRPGLRALGFGNGRERLPCVLAGLGLSVTASDAPPEAVAGQGWSSSQQYSASLDQLHHRDLIDRERFLQLVSFRQVDMNAIPDDLRGYDVCWSACALEHLGSLAHGLDFIRASLATLRPGGLALHTTEFNLGSNEETLEARSLSLFRKRDIEGLASRLTSEGHEVWPLNFHPGHALADVYVDTPPYSSPHLKLQAAGHVVTSIGIAVRKRG